MTGSRLPTRATTRMLGSVLTGVGAGIGLGLTVQWLLGLLVGLTLMHAVFVVWGWCVVWGLDPDGTRRHARREDLNPVAEEFMVVVASVGGLIAIGALLVLDRSHDAGVAAGIALAGVFAAWGSLHLMYAARYAVLYYDDERPAGIDFNPRDDVPGVGHQRLGRTDPVPRPAALLVVLRLRCGHPGQHDQPRRQCHLELSRVPGGRRDRDRSPVEAP